MKQFLSAALSLLLFTYTTSTDAQKTPTKGQVAASEEQTNQEGYLQNEITVLVNQVAYNINGPKMAIVRSNLLLPAATRFEIVDTLAFGTVFSGTLTQGIKVREWSPDLYYSQADFSSFQKPGYYKLLVRQGDKEYLSYHFQIEDQAIARTAIPAIINFFYHQRANSPQELDADKSIILYGSDRTVDLHGGWCDASGDISKYFSHLAYTNFMSPQQTPMVAMI
jgi:hypothetical protein